MREQDLVLLLYLPTTLVLYALFAARDLPTITGRRVSAGVDNAVRRAFPARGPVVNDLRIGRYVGWTAFTQVVPLLVAWSNSPTWLRAAGAAEILAAMVWTAYLLRSPSRDPT
jgi:hypothetical protein